MRFIFQLLGIPCCGFIGWIFRSMLKRACPILPFCCLCPNPFTRCCCLRRNTVLGAINLRFSVVQLVLYLLTVVGVYQMKVGTKGAVARTILKGRETAGLKFFPGFRQRLLTLKIFQILGKAILETLGKGAEDQKLQSSCYMWKKIGIGPFQVSDFPRIIRLSRMAGLFRIICPIIVVHSVKGVPRGFKGGRFK